MGEIYRCPYCGHEHELTEADDKEVSEYGKTVVDCEECKTFYCIRDDGEGRFASGDKP